MTEERADDNSADAAGNQQPPGGGRRQRWSPYGRFVRPWLRQVWLNVQVWIPFLINPFERRRLVKVAEHEARHDLDWELELPRQCWKSGARSGLAACHFEVRYRSFDRPLAIFGVMFLALMVVSTLSCLLGPWLTPTLSLVIVVLGMLVLWLKSWREQVRLTVWSLPEHADELRCPDMAIYNDMLFIYLPTIDLARATSHELRARRHERHSPGDHRAEHRRGEGPLARPHDLGDEDFGENR